MVDNLPARVLEWLWWTEYPGLSIMNVKYKKIFWATKMWRLCIISRTIFFDKNIFNTVETQWTQWPLALASFLNFSEAQQQTTKKSATYHHHHHHHYYHDRNGNAAPCSTHCQRARPQVPKADVISHHWEVETRRSQGGRPAPMLEFQTTAR